MSNPDAGCFGEPQFSTVFDNATIGMALLASDTRRIRVNKAFCDMLGYSEQDMLAQTMLDMTHPDDQAEDRRQIALLLAAGEGTYQREKRFIDVRGHTVWAAFTCSVLPHAPGRPLQFITQIQDITESRHTSRHARETAARLVNTLENLDEAFVSVDRDWRLTYVNSPAEKGLAMARADILGKLLWDVIPAAANSPFTALYHRAMAESVTLQAEEYLPVYGAWIRLKIYPSTQGLSIFYRDVTPQVQAREEIMRLNAGLEERVKQRTAELEAANKELQFFAYSIAHDLRGPLGAMDGFSQMLERILGKDLPEKAQHYLSRIRAGVHHMGELTEGLLALAQLSRAELHNVRVDLVPLAKAELTLLQSGSPDRVVELALPGTLPAGGDPRLLGQVLGNLLGNAWKFTGKQPAGRIELGSMPAPAGEAGLIYFVRDNGAGFDMAYAARLFEPFQRLHSATEFEGTGIGLAVVQKIVMRHGGRIWAESLPGEGATFYFTLGGESAPYSTAP